MGIYIVVAVLSKYDSKNFDTQYYYVYIQILVHHTKFTSDDYEKDESQYTCYVVLYDVFKSHSKRLNVLHEIFCCKSIQFWSPLFNPRLAF